ncbi:transposable element Tcb2 transposase [Trichonephila clavipes]|nr:transposable element Tcb2 transposase [Trichonephila clavipes]
MLPGSSTSLTALFHGCGSHLKLLECVVDGTAGGRVRSTTPAEDRYIVLSAKMNRRTIAQQVANQFLAVSGKQISRKTVARRLRGGGLYARRLVVCVPLTRQHRTARLQWCREHHSWTEQDWACVLFSDESRFCLSSDCRRQLIWRESGTAYRPENIQQNDRYPTCSIMVWAGIMINGRTRLHVVANGTMTGQRYIDEVLLPHVRLFRDAVDLNPIENVWDALGRQVAGRNYPPTNKNTFIRALTGEWDKLSQQLLDNVVQKAWIAVGRLEGGQTQAEVAQAIGVSQSVISRIWNRFLETESADRKPGEGRRRATTPNEDCYLVLTARRHRNMNATLLQQHLRSATDTTVSIQTVRNRLHGLGLYARRPLVCVRLTSRHRRDRRERIFIWRDRGSRNNPAFVHESVRFGGGEVLVYGGISIDGRTDLYIIRDNL